MLKNILIPEKFGNSYVFSKNVLGIEITTFAVHALLVKFKGQKSLLQKKQSIFLKDFSQQAVVGAIKKIISTIGSYDEIVTSISSSKVVFKELELPFIGRENIEMIVDYEVESLLPFSLDQAVIDFITVSEDKKNSKSKILVAATLKSDIDYVKSIFEKSGISLDSLFVDVFALSTFYSNGIYINNKKDKKSKISKASKTVELLVDIGFDVTKVIYFENNSLRGVRIIPFGVVDIAQKISKELELSYYDVLHKLYDGNDEYQKEIEQSLKSLFDDIKKTETFLQQQLKDDYKEPSKMIFIGVGSGLYNFIDYSKAYFDNLAVKINLTDLSNRLNLVSEKKSGLTNHDVSGLSLILFEKYSDDCNYLKDKVEAEEVSVLLKQIIIVTSLTLILLGGSYWKSYSALQQLESDYNISKRQMVKDAGAAMNIDLKSVRNLKDLTSKLEERLNKEQKLWFSFSKQAEQSFLEYLQDLSVNIDRSSIGLDVKKLSLDRDKVTMTASVKDYEDLEVFKEELHELELLKLDEEPREPNFTIQLKVKDGENNEQN